MVSGSGEATTLTNLDQVMTTMSKECCIHDSLAQYVESRRAISHAAADRNCWLTSIHAAYHLAEELRAAADMVSPTGILLTSDNSRSEALNSVLATMSRDFTAAIVQEPRWKGCLPHTTTWRKGLPGRLKGSASGLTTSYLHNPVKWNPKKNLIEQDEVQIWKASP